MTADLRYLCNSWASCLQKKAVWICEFLEDDTCTDLLGEIIIHNEGVSTIVSEELSHRTSRVWSEVLQRRRVWCRRTHNDCVLHGVGVRQSLHNLCDGRSLLTNSYVDAIQLCFLILAFVESLLIDDSVNGNCRLAINTISTTTVTHHSRPWSFQQCHLLMQTFYSKRGTRCEHSSIIPWFGVQISV